jgi:DNA-binding transcriptional regulator YiaG
LSGRRTLQLVRRSIEGAALIASREGIRKRRAGAEDIEIGRKIRALRLERGLSQSGLAEGIGLTFQQVQKYEKGTNRVSAGRLQQISNMLNVPITFFYGGMGARAGSVQILSHIDQATAPVCMTCGW